HGSVERDCRDFLEDSITGRLPLHEAEAPIAELRLPAEPINVRFELVHVNLRRPDGQLIDAEHGSAGVKLLTVGDAHGTLGAAANGAAHPTGDHLTKVVDHAAPPASRCGHWGAGGRGADGRQGCRWQYAGRGSDDLRRLPHRGFSLRQPRLTGVEKILSNGACGGVPLASGADDPPMTVFVKVLQRGDQSVFSMPGREMPTPDVCAPCGVMSATHACDELVAADPEQLRNVPAPVENRPVEVGG